MIDIKPPEEELTRERKIELIHEHFESFLTEHNISAEDFLTSFEAWDALGQPYVVPDWLYIDEKEK